MSNSVPLRNILLVAVWTVAVVAFVFLAYVFFVLLTVGSRMSDNAYAHSDGIEESKTNNLFLGYYRPLKDSLCLDCVKVKTEKLWYEKQWRTDHSGDSDSTIKIFPGINLVAPYDFPEQYNRVMTMAIADPESKHLVGLDEYGKLNYVAYISGAPDTVALFLETSTGFKTGNLKNYRDTIVYVKE